MNHSTMPGVLAPLVVGPHVRQNDVSSAMNEGGRRSWRVVESGANPPTLSGAACLSRPYQRPPLDSDLG